MESNTTVNDISNIIGRELKRVNLICGKGGVGRTTLAVHLAKLASQAGKKTLLAEIEDDSGWDSPLARAFHLKQFQVQPKQIEKNLFGMKLSAYTGQEAFLNSFLKIPSLTHMVLGNQGIRWFLEGAPAFKEMGYFHHLLYQLRADFDCIVIDLPATGHLVGLARLPRLLLKLIPFGPIADRLKEGQAHLYDPAKSAAWIVTLPQNLPVSEAVELANELKKEKLPVGGYILNRAPFNPFSPEEEILMNQALQKNSAPAIETALERITRFHDSEKRLQGEVKGSNSAERLFIAPEVFNPLEELHVKPSTLI